MAKRRMFSLEIVNTDEFMDMPCSAQALYFHLGMRADDDGFIPNPKRVFQSIGAKASDLKKLVEREYVILFDSGVCMIRDWQTNNHVRRDCYSPTRYQAEKASLCGGTPDAVLNVTSNVTPDAALNVTSNVTPDVASGKDSTGKDRSGKVSEGKDRSEKNGDTAPVRSGRAEGGKAEPSPQNAAEPPRPRFVPPKPEEVEAYCRERHNGIDAAHFVDFYTANGWSQGRGKPIRDWKAAVRTWEGREKNGRNDHRPRGNDTPVLGTILC